MKPNLRLVDEPEADLLVQKSRKRKLRAVGVVLGSLPLGLLVGYAEAEWDFINVWAPLAVSIGLFTALGLSYSLRLVSVVLLLWVYCFFLSGVFLGSSSEAITLMFLLVGAGALLLGRAVGRVVKQPRGKPKVKRRHLASIGKNIYRRE